MNPKEVEAEQALKHERPSTVREVRKLMGFISYYRPYIQDFSRIAKPLYELLAKPKNRSRVRRGKEVAANLLSYHRPTQSSGRKCTKRY